MRDLFADRISSLEMSEGEYVERSAGGPDEYRLLFETTFGPLIAIRTLLADDPERLGEFDRDFRDFTTRGNRGAPGGPAEYPFSYLLVVARKQAR